MTSEIEKTSNCVWNEKEKVTSNHNVGSVKSVKRLKSPKKSQECKNLNEMNIQDVFLNSEYFKYHSGNKSSLSFCSGDNGELRWTVDSKFGIPIRRKTLKVSSHPNDSIKSDTEVATIMESSKSLKSWSGKSKRHSVQGRESAREKADKLLLEGMLSEKESNDRDLISLITDQMFLAERELQITRTHLMETIAKLNERDLEIIQLHEKIQNLQKSKRLEICSRKVNGENETKESSSKTSEDYQRLVTASEKLKKQVKDMEEFLNDYGLIWVGNKDSKPDFDKIIKNFQRLNAFACQPKIIQTTLGAKFELPREIPIVLYSNGMLLRNNDFREYNSASTNLFLQDVEDGYFPSELQSEYPEGVPFEVIDKRNEVYSKNPEKPVFQGQGNRLGSSFEGKSSSVIILEPMKQSRRHETSSVSLQEYADKCHLKRPLRKRSQNISFQDDPKSLIAAHLNAVSRKLDAEEQQQQEIENGLQNKCLKVKIRYGIEKTESFILEVFENEKMQAFQTNLNRKLCERYHVECLVEDGANIRFTDFELHIYGQPPIRLSENLYKFPRECGIVDNCVINVTDI